MCGVRVCVRVRVCVHTRASTSVPQEILLNYRNCTHCPDYLLDSLVVGKIVRPDPSPRHKRHVLLICVSHAKSPGLFLGAVVRKSEPHFANCSAPNRPELTEMCKKYQSVHWSHRPDTQGAAPRLCGSLHSLQTASHPRLQLSGTCTQTRVCIRQGLQQAQRDQPVSFGPWSQDLLLCSTPDSTTCTVNSVHSCGMAAIECPAISSQERG